MLSLGKKVFQKHFHSVLFRLVSKHMEVVKYFPLDCVVLSFRLYPFKDVNATVLVSRTNYKVDKVQLDKMRKAPLLGNLKRKPEITQWNTI